MKGPRRFKRYVSMCRDLLKAYRWDDLEIFKHEHDRKWRKQNRRARDGSYGTAASYVERA